MIGVESKMASEKLAAWDWNELHDILLDAFQQRTAAMCVKGYQTTPAPKALMALFLQPEGFPGSAAELLPSVLRIMGAETTADPRYDTIAMLGHRIGIVANTIDLTQYLQNAHGQLPPGGQLLITSLGAGTDVQKPGQGQNAQPSLTIGTRQFQHANLIGPFFSLLHIQAESLKIRAKITNWRFELVYYQGEDTYLPRLSNYP
jgi:hypothetical protein